MKGLIKNILLLAVIPLYIFSTMGFGVHKCTSEGTASLIILFAESPCDHHHCNDEHNCCSTDVYVLSQDQTVVQDDFEIQLPIVETFFFAPDVLGQVADALPISFKLWTTAAKMRTDEIPQALLCTFRV